MVDFKIPIFWCWKVREFDDRYSDSYLKGDNVKIEVKLKIEEEDEETGDSGDFGDFLGVCPNNILEKNLQEEEQIQDNNNSNTSTLFEDSTQSDSNSKYNNNTHAFQKPQESQESQESPVINNDIEEVKT